MRKLRKKINNAIKILLACGMFFNNLMPLSIVFADETENNIVDEEKVLEDDKEVNLENPTTDPDVTDGDANQDDDNEEPTVDPTVGPTNGDANEPVQDEVEFEVTLDGVNLIIKHTGAAQLPEGNIRVDESFTYADGSTDEFDGYIELNEENRAALASNSGYTFSTNILSGNVYEGEFSAKVTANGEEKTVSKTIAPEGEGVELKVYTADEVEVTPVDGVYSFDKETTSFIVTARLLNGGISPDDTVTIGGEEVMAYELFEEGIIAEEELNGYLYGAFQYSLSFDYTIGEETKTASDTFIVMYGAYADNTDVLNESAKNVGLDDIYKFTGDSENGTVYVLGEVNTEDVEAILADAIGGSEVIEYTVSQDNGLIITLTDLHGVTITYAAPVLSGDTTIDNRLELDGGEDITSGSEFSVKYIVTLKDYALNGVSGIVDYDKDLFELVSITSNTFEGNNSDDKFLFLGDKEIAGSVTTDNDGNETVNEEEYIIVTVTFKALKSGTGTVTVDEGKFYNGGVYYEGTDTPSIDVTVAAQEHLLSALTVAGVEISLEEDLFDYEITVGNDVTSADVEAIVANDGSEITSLFFPNELAEGENTVTIEVTDESGKTQVYTIKVIREASQSEEKVEAEEVQPMVYTEDTGSTDSHVEVVTKPANDDKKTDDTKEKEESKTDLSRIVVIILILLVIAGLIYLIFKDEDDEETKKTNKEIDKLKKEDKPEEKSNPKKNNNPNRNNKNNNKKGR